MSGAEDGLKIVHNPVAQKPAWLNARVLSEAGLVLSLLFLVGVLVTTGKHKVQPIAFATAVSAPQARIVKLCEQYDSLAAGKHSDPAIRALRTDVVAAIRREIGAVSSDSVPPCAEKFKPKD